MSSVPDRRRFPVLTQACKNPPSDHSKENPKTGSFHMLKCKSKAHACSTLPARRHFVQTLILLTPPTALTLTFWTFEFQILLDLLCEWLTLFPKCAPLPQISHFAIMTPPHVSNSGDNVSILPEPIFLCKRKLSFSRAVYKPSSVLGHPAAALPLTCKGNAGNRRPMTEVSYLRPLPIRAFVPQC